MKKKLVVALALVALAGFAAANALTVTQRQDTASLHAERYTVGGLFLIENSQLAPVPAALDAIGEIETPMELASVMPAIRTALAQDHWAYSVTVREALPGAVTAGAYAIELQRDGIAAGTVYVEQATPEADATEGVRASFDLGTTLGPSSLYYVVVKPYTPAGSVVSFSVRSAPEEGGTLRWFGVGGDIQDLVNPDLPVPLGKTLRVTAAYDDPAAGTPHNLVFRTSGGETLAGPTDNIDADGEQVTLTWTPPSAGTYTYVCQYHSTMTGDLVVA